MKRTLKIDIQYSLEADNLYIALCDERSSFGSMKYQDDVIIFKNRDTDKIIGIEILHFKEFSKSSIQFNKSKSLNFGGLFNLLKSLIFAFELKKEYPDTFNLIMKSLGFQRVPKFGKRIINHPSKFLPNISETLPERELESLCH